MRIIIIILLLLSSFSISYADSTNVSDQNVRNYPLVFRLNMTYVPVGSIEFTNTSTTYDIYDNLYYRFSAEYLFLEFLSGGVSAEYMKKHIDPVSYHNIDITGMNLLADFKLVHNLTETGSTKLLTGFGTGIASLKEESGESNSNIIFYGVTGLDIALWRNLGFDLIYRYQFTNMKIGYSKYSYNGSSLQFGLNYGIEL